MGIERIPARTILKCDVNKCPNTHEGVGALPIGWMQFTMQFSRDDFQGNIVASGEVNRTLCPNCARAISTIINDYSPSVRS